MTEIKPHIKLDIRKQNDGSARFKYKTRYPGENIKATEAEEEEESEEIPEALPNYEIKARDFNVSLNRLIQAAQRRQNNRNPDLQVPDHIHYITINFHNQFDIPQFYNYWLETYGLLGVNFTEFNATVLFAVIESQKANTLVRELRNFISKELQGQSNLTYDNHIVFIKDFKLHATPQILGHTITDFSLVKIHLADFPIADAKRESIIRSLIDYLQQRGGDPELDEVTQVINLKNTTSEQLTEIADNFDVVLSITSSLATVIGPSSVQQPVRSYGFTVDATDNNLPLIGVVDTGVSQLSPLKDVLIEDDSFNVTTTSPFIDNVNHGTGVAAFAALGREPYAHNYRGTFKADGRILSIKVTDSQIAPLPDSDVIKLLLEAKRKYPAIKIFVLSICYDQNKTDNENYSSYAYELDKFSHENDCLVFICTSNNNQACTDNTDYDYRYFGNQRTNLSTPAESMNNLTVGAAADCLRTGVFEGISPGIEHPTLYTRKFHLDLPRYFSIQKLNKKLFKPDVIEAGGDYERSSFFIGQGERASLEVLSANPTESFFKQVGTSYSAPLTANIAAKILKNYPSLRAQTLKALIINAASLDKIRFPDAHSKMLNYVAGNGLVNTERAVYSNSNAATIIVEDEIKPGDIIGYPIHLPTYLTTEDHKKKRGLLKVTATLCMSFEPVPFNQLSYCPVHIAFSVFRNRTLDQITDNYTNSKLKEQWSQDGYYKKYPKVWSNSQKIQFYIDEANLLDENHQFKIALNCSLSNQVLPTQKANYNCPHKFSLVVTIEENMIESRLTGKFYNELVAINHLESISTLSVEGTTDLEAEA